MASRAHSVGVALTATLSLGLGLLATSPSVARDVNPLTSTLQDLADDGTPSPVSSDDLLTTARGRLLVNVRLTDVSEANLARLRATGARVRFVDEALRTVTVAIAEDDLDQLAELTPLVESAQEVLQPLTNAAACPSGPFVSEGVTQLKAALARTQFSVTGRDVTVGVISDSHNSLSGAATDVANGDLPGAANPCGNTSDVDTLLEGPAGSTDEGRAMAQIVHDVAPGAKILFASAFYGDLAFAQSIRDLAAQGADIIVDDVTYLSEPFYQDGPIAKAVSDVTAQGVVYFSSAANSNWPSGANRVGSYEAPAFRPMGCPAAIVTHFNPTPVSCHNFNPFGADNTYGFTFGSRLRYTLGWNEPQFGVSTELDVCLLTSAITLVGCVQDENVSTTQLASEVLSYNGSGSFRFVVVRRSATGTPRFKLISHRSDLGLVEYPTSAGGDVVGPTIFGHNASIPGVTVAAVPFNNNTTLEWFSSWGPAQYCWGPVTGTTPAAPLVPCQSATVDLTASDGGQNSFFGAGDPPRFYGTSAAAPHAAAVAALMLDKEQCLTPTQVINTLKSTANAVGATPVDGAGSGLVDSVAALTSANSANCDTTGPLITIGLSGWYRTPTVAGTVTAKDHRLVTALTCTGGTLSAPTGLTTPQARATISVSGEGSHTVGCQGTDIEGNTGTAPPTTFGIDTGAPSVMCRPANFKAGQSAMVSADVQDALSGPAAPTVSAAVPTNAAGSFTVAITGADVAGNTTTVSCGYTVTSSPAVKGASKAKAGATKRYRAVGFPASSKVKWTVKRGGRKLATRKLRTNASGVSAVTVTFPRKGRYVISAKAGSVSAAKRVRVR